MESSNHSTRCDMCRNGEIALQYAMTRDFDMCFDMHYSLKWKMENRGSSLVMRFELATNWLPRDDKHNSTHKCNMKLMVENDVSAQPDFR